MWSGNVLTDSIAGQSIGILIPNATLTFAQAEYEAGLMAYRLQNAQTLAVSARGWGVKAGANCMSEAGIGPVRRVAQRHPHRLPSSCRCDGAEDQRPRLGFDHQRPQRPFPCSKSLNPVRF